MFSQFTREFWTKCVEEDGHRPDGRALLEYRSIGLNTGTLSHCDGSAVVKLGSCIVVCGVKSELLTPIQHMGKPKMTVFTAYRHDHTTDSLYTEHLNTIFQNFYLSSLANQTHSRPSVVSTDQLWVVLDKLCWVLYVDCVSLTPSVSLDACVLATTAALQNTQLPRVMVNDDGIPEVTNDERTHLDLSSFPLTATMASINHEIVVDPSCEELKICDGTAQIISNRPQLNTINIEGIIGDENDIKKCLEAAPKVLLALKTLLNSVCVNS